MEQVMEIPGHLGEKRPLFRASGAAQRATREALAKYVIAHADAGRRKWAEKRWDLTPDQARSVVEGTASAATIDLIWKHRNGGWAVLLPVMGAVVGHSFEDFISKEQERLTHERRAYEKREARLVEMARDLRALPDLGGVRVGELRSRQDRDGR